MRLTMAILLGAACAMVGFGQTQQVQKAPQEKQAKPPSGDAGKQTRGKGEGIQIHGHWVLEIKNPDGSVASRTEFENSLAGQGPSALALLLSGQAQAQTWLVQIGYNTPANAGYPNATGCNSVPTCDVLTMDEPPDNFCTSGSSNFPLCNESIKVQQNSANQVVITGVTVPAISAGTIPSVSTFVNLCQPINNSCVFIGGYSFSQANTNVAIQTGQTIDMSVTYGFS